MRRRGPGGIGAVNKQRLAQVSIFFLQTRLFLSHLMCN